MTKLFAIIAVGLDAAAEISKSKMEKAAASVAAAIVGIGLFLAPVENAQAQSRTVPSIDLVEINGCFDDDPTVFTFDWLFNSNLSRYWPDGYFRTPIYSDACLYQYGYMYVKFYRAIWSSSLNRWVASRSDWIEVWVWMGVPGFGPYAYVYDSDSVGFYEVDLFADGYWLSGPGLYSVLP